MEENDLALQLALGGDVYLWAEITPESALETLRLLQLADEHAQAEALRLWVCSPGGDLYSALALYNACRHLARPVDTYCLGIAASAASLVLQAGRTRYMAPHSWLMVHEHRTLLPEVASSELKREARLSARLDEQLLRIYERRAKLSRRRLRKLLAEEGWLSATEAVRLGLADRIMEVRHG